MARVRTAARHRPASAILSPQLAAIAGRSASAPPIVSGGITMTLASVSLLLIASALFAVLARLDPTD